MNPLPRLLAALALLASGWAQAANPPEAASAPVPAASSAGEHAHARIRQAHLGRLYERLTTEPAELKRQCRFESDISTPPPPGVVALSFDDGPDPERTELILDVLDRYKIQASFFFIGEKMRKYPELVAKVLAKGHLVGSHSWSHPNFHDIADAAQEVEILRGIEEMPFAEAFKVYRYPYGNSSCGANDVLHGQGYHIVGWHVDSCDWAFDRTGSVDTQEALSCGVSSQDRSDFVGHVAAAARARKGGIVLMHEIHPNTLAKLPEVIDALRKDGFTFARVDDPRFAASLR